MTDYGLDDWTKNILGTHIALGSGARDELSTVTDLEGYVRTASGAYSYTNTNFIDLISGVMRSDHILNITFPIESSPQNYSEMGIHNNNASQLQTYARIRDAIGDPASISVQQGEQVRCSYAVQFSTPLSRVTSQTIGANLTTITTVPLATGAGNAVRLPNTPVAAGRLWAAGQSIPEAGIAPTGGVAPPRASSVANGLYTMSIQKTEANLAGGISLIRMGGTSGSVGIMCHFDPPIAKTELLGMSVTITSTLENGIYHES